MPHHDCPLEQALVKTKSSKSSKKCCPESPCAIPCCVPDCQPDCCTPAYSRLDKLRKGWSLLATNPAIIPGSSTSLSGVVTATYVAPSTLLTVPGAPYSGTATAVFTNVVDRSDVSVPLPVSGTYTFTYTDTDAPGSNTATWTFDSSNVFGTNGVNFATYAITDSFASTASSYLVTPTTSLPNGPSTAFDVTYDNALFAYMFVNSHRYVNFEACGKEDQVVGWYVDVSDGQLQLFQDLPALGLLRTNTRLDYLNIPPLTLTSIEKQKLHNLNILYSASEDLIARISSNPKEEGNICEYTDKCGQKWLLAINRANSEVSIASPSVRFVIVGVPLC